MPNFVNDTQTGIPLAADTPTGEAGVALETRATIQNTHQKATAAHGATGAVVGTTNTQTLSNKTISGSANTLTNIPESAVTNLSTDLAAKANLTGAAFTGYTSIRSPNTDPAVPVAEIGSSDPTYGQAVLGFTTNGVTRGVFRADYVGGLTFNAGAGIDFMVGGIYPSTTGGMQLHADGLLLVPTGISTNGTLTAGSVSAASLNATSAANPCLLLSNAGATRAFFALATNNTAWASETVINDAVLRTEGGSIYFNTGSGTGTSVMSITGGNAGVSISGPLNATLFFGDGSGVVNIQPSNIAGYPAGAGTSFLNDAGSWTAPTLNGILSVSTDAGGYDITNVANIDASTAYKVGGAQVVGGQQGAIADATDETDAVGKLNSLLAAMRTHGLIAA